jgi:hypothetical protein
MLEHERLKDIIRKLREQIYYKTKHSYAHEREWESEEQEVSRELYNKEKRLLWDKETEDIIDGKKQIT